jgi:hypothetical protein
MRAKNMDTGMTYTFASIYKDGTFKLVSHVSKETGLNLTDRGVIKLI